MNIPKNYPSPIAKAIREKPNAKSIKCYGNLYPMPIRKVISG
jgi:hypothetical protein